jgi:hypothetical protein
MTTPTLQDAKRMLAAGEAKADQIGIPYKASVPTSHESLSFTAPDQVALIRMVHGLPSGIRAIPARSL